jgi:hypothetical protein
VMAGGAVDLHEVPSSRSPTRAKYKGSIQVSVHVLF